MGITSWILLTLVSSSLIHSGISLVSEEEDEDQKSPSEREVPRDLPAEVLLSRTHNLSENKVYYKCKETCNNFKKDEFMNEEILECEISSGYKCLSKFFLLCVRNNNCACDWETFETGCSLQASNPKSSTCIKLIEKVKLNNKYRSNCGKSENNIDGGVKRSKRSARNRYTGMNRIETMDKNDMGGSLPTNFVPPHRKSNLAASSSGPGAFSFSSDGENIIVSDGVNGPNVATSGNAHAYSSDGIQAIESHNGGPPLPGEPVDPFSIFGMAKLPLPMPPEPPHPAPKHPDFAFMPPPPPPPPGTPVKSAGSAASAGSFPSYTYAGPAAPFPGQGAYTGPSYSPFTNVFASVGLQDPFMMLQNPDLIPEPDSPVMMDLPPEHPAMNPRPPTPPRIIRPKQPLLNRPIPPSGKHISALSNNGVPSLATSGDGVAFGSANAGGTQLIHSSYPSHRPARYHNRRRKHGRHHKRKHHHEEWYYTD